MKLKRILVTTDFSPLAQEAVEPAVELVGSEGCLILVHVLEGERVPKPDPQGPHFKVAQKLYENDQVQEQDALKRLEGILRKYEGLTWRAVIKRGDPIPALLSTAAEEQADLIVISSSGRTGLSRVFLGSVAEELARSSPLPVLIWKRATPADA